MSHFEHVKHLGLRCDQAKLAATTFHVPVKDHEDAEARAIQELDTGEVEDELMDALAGKFADLGFNLAKAHAQGHASGQAEDCCG